MSPTFKNMTFAVVVALTISLIFNATGLTNLWAHFLVGFSIGIIVGHFKPFGR